MRPIKMISGALILLVAISQSAVPAAGNDGEPPVISEINVAIIGETFFVVEWRTDVPAKGGVEWGRTKDYGNVAEEGGDLTTTHSLNVTGMIRATDYHFRIYATDADNDTGRSEDFLISTYPSGGEDDPDYFVPTAVALAVIIIVVVAIMAIRYRGKD
jgi:hypothetical protein